MMEEVGRCFLHDGKTRIFNTGGDPNAERNGDEIPQPVAIPCLRT